VENFAHSPFMLAEIMALFNPEIGALIRPSESLKASLNRPSRLRATAAKRENDYGVSVRIRPNHQRGLGGWFGPTLLPLSAFAKLDDGRCVPPIPI
jgi:hypothetical protein